jgi:Dipeptidyl peptidase IV (DPP IV) N-terminal region
MCRMQQTWPHYDCCTTKQHTVVGSHALIRKSVPTAAWLPLCEEGSCALWQVTHTFSTEPTFLIKRETVLLLLCCGHLLVDRVQCSFYHYLQTRHFHSRLCIRCACAVAAMGAPQPPPVQLTFGSTDTVKHGVADFIAQEEMDRYRGFWWSLDSKVHAFLSDNGIGHPLRV